MGNHNSSSFQQFWDQRSCGDQWSGSPTQFVEKLLLKDSVQRVDRLEGFPLQDDTQGYIRFVCVSDTHDQTERINFEVPEGDVLIHAGDFTQVGMAHEVNHFADWLDTLPHKTKVVIPGNHELSFDVRPGNTRGGYTDSKTRDQCIARLKQSCTFLEDEMIDVHGYKVYGSPWQPEFGGWAYNLKRGAQCVECWERIPTETELLVTHGPPAGHGDLCRGGVRAGCVDLLQTIQTRVKPLYHIFGHIHEDGGITTDGQTNYINASTCDIRYNPSQWPVVFDLPKKDQ